MYFFGKVGIFYKENNRVDCYYKSLLMFVLNCFWISDNKLNGYK